MQPDQQVGADHLPVHLVGADAGAELDPVGRAAAVEHRVLAVAMAEHVGVVAGAALQLVRPAAARQTVVRTVEADQAVVAIAALEHAHPQIGKRQQRPVGKGILLDRCGRKPAADAQHVRRVAEVDQQVVAVASQHQIVGADAFAKDHPIKHARAVGPLDDLVKVVPDPEGVGIGQIAAEQLVIALTAVQHVLLVQQAHQHVVAAVAALDRQQLLDIRDVQRLGGELEPFDPVEDRAELIADSQRVGAVGEGDHEVEPDLGELRAGQGQSGAEDHPIVGLRLAAAPSVPAGALLPVEDLVLSVACVEKVAVAVGPAHQRVVARPPVQGFRELAALDQVGARGAHPIDVPRPELAEVHRHVGEVEELHRIGLPALAPVLVEQGQRLAGGAQADDQVACGAVDLHIRGGDAGQHHPVGIAAGVEHRVRPLPGPPDVGVRPPSPFQPVVAGPAVDHVGGVEAVDRVVALGPCEVDQVLEQLGVAPARPVAPDDLLDQVHEAHEGRRKLLLLQPDGVAGVADAQAQRVGPAVAQELDVAPGDAAVEPQRVVGRPEQLDRPVAIGHHVLPAATTEQEGVATLAPDQDVVARAAVQRVGVDETVDRIGAVGACVAQHPFRDLREFEEAAVLEQELLDRVGGDIVDAEAGVDPAEERAEVQAHAAELVTHGDLVAGECARSIEQADQQVGAFTRARQVQVVGSDVAQELDVVEPALARRHGDRVHLLDDVLPVAAAVQVDVAPRAAAQHVVAKPSVQHVERPGPHDHVVRVARVAHRPGDAERVPHHAIGKDQRLHGRVFGVVPEGRVQLAQEVVAHRDLAGAALDRQDQVLPDPPRDHLGRGDIREPQFIGRTAIDILDDDVAEALADEIDIRPRAAAERLVAFPDHEEIGAVGAGHHRLHGIGLHEQVLVDAQRVHRAQKVDVGRLRLERGQHHLEDVALIERQRRSEDVAARADVHIGVKNRQDGVPALEVIALRLGAVRRRGEDGVEHRRKRPIGRQAELVGRRVIGKSREERGKPTLEADAQGKGARCGDVLVHHRVQHVDHHGDARLIDRIGQAGLPCVVHRIGDPPCGMVEGCGQHRRVHLEPRQLGGEVELAGGQELDAIDAVHLAFDDVERGEIDRIGAQVVAEGGAGLELQLQRLIEHTRPDVEAAVAVGDLHGVVHHLPVDLIDPDPVHRQRGQRVVPDLLEPPLAPGAGRLRQDVGAGGRGDRLPVGTEHRVSAGKRP